MPPGQSDKRKQRHYPSWTRWMEHMSH